MKALLILIILLPCFASTIVVQAEPWMPSPREKSFDWMSLEKWYAMHEEDKAIANKGEARLLFLGDSITQGWDSEIWQQHFGPFNAANFGIGGDKTQNLLWRLQNGGAGKLQPKLVVLMIGVNNFGHDNDSAEDVVKGVDAILDEINKRFPSSKILLLGILPYGEKQDGDNRKRVNRANTLLKKMGEQRAIVFRDYGSLFVDGEGNIPRELMGDLLHPTAKGYALLAEQLAPLLTELMNK